MRILHCIPTMSGGGAEKQLCYLSEGLVRRGHDVHVGLLSDDGVHGPRLRASGATIHKIGDVGSLDPRGILSIAMLIRRVKPDLVQTWLTRMDLWGGVTARALGVPWIFCERSSRRERMANLRDRVSRAQVRRAAAVVCNSVDSAETWRANLDDRAQVEFIPNAVPVEEIQATKPIARSALGVPDTGPLIVYAGKLSHGIKNVIRLTEALCEVFDERPDVHAVYCGEGEQEAEVRAIFARRGHASRCRLLGFRGDVIEILRAGDVFVSPSNFEGRPNTVGEAMACGLPLVISDITSHREFVPADAAWFFHPARAQEIAERLRQCLDDPAERAAKVERALAHARKFSVDAMAKSYEAVYERILRPKS